MTANLTGLPGSPLHLGERLGPIAAGSNAAQLVQDVSDLLAAFFEGCWFRRSEFVQISDSFGGQGNDLFSDAADQERNETDVP